jgi:hypothetical protein
MYSRTLSEGQRRDGFEARLAGQLGSDALPTKVGEHGHAVDVAPPAVPGRDQRADDLAFVLGHQQRVVGVRDQPGDRPDVIGRDGSGTARLVPEREHAANVLKSRGADDDVGGRCRLGQAGNGSQSVGLDYARRVR